MAFYFDAKVIKEGENALLVEVLDDSLDEDEVWIPFSQITKDSEVTGEGDEGTVAVTDWLARERGWAE